MAEPVTWTLSWVSHGANHTLTHDELERLDLESSIVLWRADQDKGSSMSEKGEVLGNGHIGGVWGQVD